jgi:hypothetical protein
MAPECSIQVPTSRASPTPCSKQAATAALAGLDAAIDATAWMETLATTDGEYPLLRD